jgi:hypothetical protein
MSFHGVMPGDSPARDAWAERARAAPGLALSPAAAGAAAKVTARPSGEVAAARDRSGRWLRNAAAGLCVLAAAAAAVSFTAQYRMVDAARRLPVIAGLEAVIPDAVALVFACLGVALALHGRRAIRARVFNIAAVATSVFMNTIAAAPGWRSLAIWAMPPVAYALASDTLIGVVRSWAITRHRGHATSPADDEATPLAVLGGLLLWLLRLAVAPLSTLAGFRSWVVEECPVAPGRRARPTRPNATTPAAPRPVKEITGRPKAVARQPGRRAGTKTARFLALAADRHGPLDTFPLADVSRVSTQLAPEVGLDPGAARAALRRHVRSLQNGDAR